MATFDTTDPDRDSGGSMTDDQLRAFIKEREARATRTEVAAEQALAYDYYLRRPMGNEEEGRSQVISSDVWDVVEGMTPAIVEPFVSSSDLVTFNAMGPEDEDAAKQETDYVNYVVTQRNDAFIQFLAWAKCGLLFKNGVVKWWWDTTHRDSLEVYRGVTDDVVASLAQDPEAKIVGISEIPPAQGLPDPGAEAARAQQAQAAAQAHAAGPGGMPGMPPGPAMPPAGPVPGAGPAPGMQQPAPEPTYDVRVRIRRREGFARYEVVPPEELLVIGRDPNIQKSSFVQHRTRKTLSELREMGYDVDDELSDGGEGDVTTSEVYTARVTGSDPIFEGKDDSPADPSMREVWFRESYTRVDFDGDGVAELRKICMVGDEILANEETEEIPFAGWTPYQQLFQYDGRCPADEAVEIQDVKTTLWRQALDNVYTTNNNRVFASKKVDIDDLLDNQIAGVVRVNADMVQGHVQSLPVTPLGPIIMPMIEYADSTKENRTGFSRYNQGDADLGNQKTLGEVQLVTGMSGKRTGLIQRSLAEQGMKTLMLGIHGLLRRHATKDETVRLRGQWVTVDPRSWRQRMDMTVSVGTGTQDTRLEMASTQEILKMQAGLAAAGIVTPENQYNAAAKFAALTGEKNTDRYFTHPTKIPKPAAPDPMQDPKVMLEVAQHRLEAMKTERELAQKDRELDQKDRALDQVDQKQGIESTNAQLAALERQHRLQLETEAHVQRMANEQQSRDLAARQHELSEQQQAHQQGVDQAQVEQGARALELQAEPPEPAEPAGEPEEGADAADQ